MFSLFPAYLLPVAIFLARILDVSLGTIRIVMVARGFKFRAAALGFFEVLIWVIVVSEVLANLDHWVNFVAYAAGFAAGTFSGMLIEDRLKVGTIIVRIITPNDSRRLLEALREAGFILTVVSGRGGLGGPVSVIFTILRRRRFEEIVAIIERHDPKAFYSYEDVKYATSEGFLANTSRERTPLGRLLWLRKEF